MTKCRPRTALPLLVAGVSLVLAAGLLPATVAPAGAATARQAQLASAAAVQVGEKTFDRRFTRSRLIAVPKLKRCVRIQMAGRIKGTRKTFRHGSGFGNAWSDVRIVGPSMRATTYARGASGCGATARVRKFVLRQTWKKQGCDVSIQSISFGAPWSIAAGFGCSGDDDTAWRQSVDPAGTYVTQYNSKTVIRFRYKECGTTCAFPTNVRAFARLHRRMGGGNVNDHVAPSFRVSLPG